jgi:sarcosine oxidase
VSPVLDVAVVGAGIVGLSVTEALAGRGAEVRCFEAARAGAGQSAGVTRIFRHRHDDDGLVALAARARRGWRQWEERLGRTLLGGEGVMFAGFGAEHADRLERHGLPVRFLDGEAQRARFGLVSPVSGPVLLDESGGALRARRAVEALLGRLGDRVLLTEVLGVSVPPDGAGPQLHTAEGIVAARHVVICAGAGTPRLAAGAGITVPQRCGLHARPMFRVRPEHASATMACWIDRSGEHGEWVYGSPAGSTGRYAIGLAGEDGAVPLGAGGESPAGTDMREHVRRVAGYVRRALPGLDPEPESVRMCVSTSVGDRLEGFRAWQAAGVTALAGSNLFKFAPVLGQLLGDAAMTGELPAELAAAGDS